MKEPTQQLFLSNANANIREQIIFGRNYDPAAYAHGGVCPFRDLCYGKAKRLLDEGYLPPEDKQNDAPTAQEFLDFMAAHDPDNWTLHGYSVSPTREDVRVSIEGIRSLRPLTDHDMVDFLRTFRSATKLIAEDEKPVYCWYD